jgi:rhodanese-related sulfurtransferase
MKKYFSVILILIWFSCSCKSIKQPPAVTHIDIAIFSEGIRSRANLSIIDTRSESDYLNGHIKGALNIPISEIRKGTPKCRSVLAKIFNTELYIYCSGSGCDSSSEAAKYLQYCEFKAIYVFDGGWQQWSLLYSDDLTGIFVERK